MYKNECRFASRMYFYIMKNNSKILQVVCYITIICSIVLVSSCKKTNSDIPYAYVNEYVNLSLPSYLNATIPNGWVYYPAGNRGLIIFRRSSTEIVVYDRTCTYDPTATCALVRVIPNNILAIDSGCGSQFSLFDGSVTNGPAVAPLKQYHADLLSNNSLHIYN